jgi:methyl-accepting chemotaxis protein
MKLNLTKKIILYILPVVILSFIVTILIVSMEAQNTVLQNVYAGMQAIASQSTENIRFKRDSTLRDAITLSKTTAIAAYYETLSFDMQEEAEIYRIELHDFFIDFLERTDIYSRLCYIDPQGTMIVDISRTHKGTLVDELQSSPQLPEEQGPFVSSVVYSDVTQRFVIHVFVPSYSSQDTYVGYIFLELDWDNVLATLQDVKIGKSGYIMIADQNSGLALCYPPDQTQILALDFREHSYGQQMLQQKDGLLDYIQEGEKWTLAMTTLPETNWILAVTLPWKDITSDISRLNRKIWGAAMISIAIICLLIWFLAKSISKPIQQMLTIVTEKITRGDFRQSITVRQQDEIGALADAFRKMQHVTIHVVREVNSSINTVAQRSQELNTNAEMLSEGTAQQAAATEEASASMQEMTANIRQNADNARQTELLAQQAVQSAEESGEVVAETVLAMQQIVGQISVVQDIANQTRLLSLNATIEASRAQEFGKAFGVVAHEVRSLAETTRTAAERIVQLASSSMDISQKAGTMLATLVPNIQKTAELVQEISAASAEQSSGAMQVNKAIQQLDQVTQQNAASAEQVAAASEALANQAAQLQKTIAFFTIPEAPIEQPGFESELLNGLRTLFTSNATDEQVMTRLRSLLGTSIQKPAVSESVPPDHEPTSDQSGETSSPPASDSRFSGTSA